MSENTAPETPAPQDMPQVPAEKMREMKIVGAAVEMMKIAEGFQLDLEQFLNVTITLAASQLAVNPRVYEVRYLKGLEKKIRALRKEAIQEAVKPRIVEVPNTPQGAEPSPEQASAPAGDPSGSVELPAGTVLTHDVTNLEVNHCGNDAVKPYEDGEE